MGTFDGLREKKPHEAAIEAVVHKAKVWWKRRSTKEKTAVCGLAGVLVTPGWAWRLEACIVLKLRPRLAAPPCPAHTCGSIHPERRTEHPPRPSRRWRTQLRCHKGRKRLHPPYRW